MFLSVNMNIILLLMKTYNYYTWTQGLYQKCKYLEFYKITSHSLNNKVDLQAT